MTILDTFLEQKISGWGRYPFSKSKIYVPSEISQIQEIIMNHHLKVLLEEVLEDHMVTLLNEIKECS